MVRNDIKNSSLLKTKFLIYAFNGRTQNAGSLPKNRQNKRRETLEKATFYLLFNLKFR